MTQINNLECQLNFIIPNPSGMLLITPKPSDITNETKNGLISSGWNDIIESGALSRGFVPKMLISGDYNIFNDGWNASGVYACSGNYISETFRTPWYIGSAGGEFGLKKRIIYEHIAPLQSNKHYHNPPLQKSWNKHGKENFVWWMLEECSPEECVSREQFYFDLYRPFVDECGGFNIAHDAAISSRGRVVSEETKLKMSEAMTGKKRTEGQKEKMRQRDMTYLQTEECKRKRFEKIRGRKQTDQARQNIQRGIEGAIAKTVKIVSPEGKVVEIYNLSKFCKERGLSQGNMYSVVAGKRNTHKGWRMYIEGIEEYESFRGAIRVRNKNNISHIETIV